MTIKTVADRERERLDAYRAGYLDASIGKGLSVGVDSEYQRAYLDGARDWQREARRTR